LEVSDMAISVRPWKARSNAMTAGRPVACRAILTAFSTASAPELKNAALFGPAIGLRAVIRSASSTYDSYGTIVKSVCRKRSIWAWSASETAAFVWPTFRQPMPPDQSRKVLPSTSVTTQPWAWSSTMGVSRLFASATTRSLRATIS
jgi:hypothetical protein